MTPADLKALRHSLRLNYRDMAHRMCVSPRTMTHLEGGADQVMNGDGHLREVYTALAVWATFTDRQRERLTQRLLAPKRERKK